MMLQETYDAMIVGAGPAGSSLAIRLARAGWRVLLIDAGRFPRQKVCGECLPAVTLDLAEELGIAASMRSQAMLHERLRIRLPEGSELSLALDGEAAGPVLGFSRHALDWVLFEWARECGVQTLQAHRARQVLLDADGVCGLELSAAPPGEPAIRVQSRIVIAADGRSSKLVRQTGRVLACGPALVGFKRHLSGENTEAVLPAATIDMHSFSGGYLGVCRVEDGSLNVCGLAPRRNVSQTRGNIREALARLLPAPIWHALDAGSEAAQWCTVPGVQQQWSTPRVPGILYVGDAQGTIEPLAGQGMWMAMAGAALAAELLLDAGRGGVSQSLQQHYQAAWRARFRGSIAWARRFGWLLRHPRVLAAMISGAPLPGWSKEYLAHAAYCTTLSSLRQESRNRHGQRRRIAAS